MCNNLIISHRGVDIAPKGGIRYLGVTCSGQPTQMEGTHSACKAKMLHESVQVAKSQPLSPHSHLREDIQCTCITSLRLLLCVVAFMRICPHSQSGTDTELRDEDYHFLF